MSTLNVDIINPESGLKDIYHSHINLTEYLMNQITENKIFIQIITIIFMICLLIYICY